MKIYIDLGSGVAGDMLISALVDLGLPARQLEKALLNSLKLKDCRLQFKRTERKGWPAGSFRVVEDRWFGSLESMIRRVRSSGLPSPVKDRSCKVLQDLLWAEQQAHGHPTEVDELGMLDTLIDVTGSTWGFWKLGIETADASHLNTGRIAPATSALINKYRIPIYSETAQYELATPTGVAILANVVGSFTGLAPQQLEKAGYGAGTKDLPHRPNVLGLYQVQPLTLPSPQGRGMNGHSLPTPSPLGRGTKGEGYQSDSVLLLETVIDDMDPRLYPHVTEMLFKAGALDVWWTSVGMKKGRPGIAYSVLCPGPHEMKILDVLFQETTTLGIRRSALQRWILPRESRGLRKLARLPNGAMKSQTEYEYARRLALKDAIPLRKVLK